MSRIDIKEEVINAAKDLRGSYRKDGFLGLALNVGIYAATAMGISAEATLRAMGRFVEKYPRVVKVPLDLALYAADGVMNPRIAARELRERVG